MLWYFLNINTWVKSELNRRILTTKGIIAIRIKIKIGNRYFLWLMFIFCLILRSQPLCCLTNSFVKFFESRTKFLVLLIIFELVDSESSDATSSVSWYLACINFSPARFKSGRICSKRFLPRASIARLHSTDGIIVSQSSSVQSFRSCFWRKIRLYSEKKTLADGCRKIGQLQYLSESFRGKSTTKEQSLYTDYHYDYNLTVITCFSSSRNLWIILNGRYILYRS